MKAREIGQASLYRGDCADVIPLLAQGIVHAVVTDPPYGIGYQPNVSGRGVAPRGKYRLIEGDDKPFDPLPMLALAPITVLFGANHYANRLPASPSWFVWYKRLLLPSNDFADCEFAWSNVGGPARVFAHQWSGMIRDSERREPRVHPTQKPVALMKWILAQLRLPPGAVVFDGYMGSGSVGIAAIEMGYQFIGAEIDEEYFEVACDRIGRASMQPVMMSTFEEPPEQLSFEEVA